MTTVSVPPAGALTTAVPVLRSEDTSRNFGNVAIAWTTVAPPCASVTVTGVPVTLSAALQPPPRTLIVLDEMWSVYVNENDRPVIPLAADLQISMVPGRVDAWAGSWVNAPAATEPTAKVGSSNKARRPRGFIRSPMDRPPLDDLDVVPALDIWAE